MSNALSTAAAGNVTAGSNPFAMAGSGAGDSLYVKFKGATGEFTYGPDDDEMEHGTVLAADVLNSKWNWTFWWEGEVLETRETFITADPMGWENEPNELPEKYDGDMSLQEIRAEQADRKSNFMDGWSCQCVINMRATGIDGAEYTFKLNQGVALNSFRKLLLAFGKQFRFREGLVPLVEIDARSYKSKAAGVGKRYAPQFKIVDWKSEEDLMDDDIGDDDGMYDAPGADEPKAIEAPKEEAASGTPRRRGARGARGNY